MERELLSIYTAISNEIRYRSLLISDWARFTSLMNDKDAIEKCDSFYWSAVKDTNEEITDMYSMLYRLIEDKGSVEEFFKSLTD